MSRPRFDCPQCGATIEFQYSSAIQTVCEYCRSILVRHDVNLDKVGVQADLPLEASPIQLRAEGQYQGKAFWVAGRILYEYDQGFWNEWHIVFQDGRSGWLSDAQLEYAVSFLSKPPEQLPQASALKKDKVFKFGNESYRATVLTEAFYKGVEGELPFEYWDQEKVLFADLRSHTGKFGTIDYSEDPPLLFLGEFVQLTDLKMNGLRRFEGW